MKFIYSFLKYFLFFNSNFLSPIVNDLFARTESMPYGLLYIKSRYFFYIMIALLFPSTFILHSVIMYGLDATQIKFAIIFLSFLSGLWIINNDIIKIEVENAAKYFFYFFILLGIFQYFSFFNFLNNETFNIFFSRGNLGVGQSYRGVSFFYTEVARASYYLMFIYLLAYGLKHTKENFFPFIILFFYEIFLISSTTGIILIFFLTLIRYPKFTSSFMFIIILFFFAFNSIINIPEFNHYKIDFLLNLLITYQFEKFSYEISNLSGGRYDGIIFSLTLMTQNPLGVFYNPYFFETTSGRLPVSGPLLFIRTFGIFSVLYLLLFFKSLGKGNRVNALLVFLLACIYSPNGAWLTLAVVYKEYKNKI